ncbi:MAG: hypothetical protein KDD94_02515 [Calditrichaeota bacterium]|nr:hypothetical protein [Calditrichota bacterium]
MKYIVGIFVFFVISHGQDWLKMEGTVQHNRLNGSKFLSSSFQTNLSYKQISVYTFLNINDFREFEIESDREFSFETAEKIVIDDRDNDIPLDVYKYDEPFESSLEFSDNSYSFLLSAKLFHEKARIESWELQQSDSLYYRLSSVYNEFENYSLVGRFYLEKQFTNFAVGLEWSNIRLSSFINDRFKYHRKLERTISLLLNFFLANDQLNSRLNTQNFELSYQHQSDWIKEASAINLSVSRGYETYIFDRLAVQMEYPITIGTIQLSAKYVETGKFTSSRFNSWQQSNTSITELPQFSLSAAIQIDLKPLDNKVELLSSNLRNTDFFITMKSYYQDHPNLFLQFENKNKRKAELHLKIYSVKNSIYPEDKTITVAANSLQEIELSWLFKDIKEATDDILKVELIDEKSNRLLAEHKIKILPEHFWDSNVRSLKYYLGTKTTETHRFVRTEIGKLNKAADPNESNIEKLNYLKNVLQLISKGIRFIRDPINTNNYESVQYPDETFLAKQGDCEDLSLYYLSALRSLGIETAIIDYKPSAESIGHLSILVNTKIPAGSYLTGEINEFNSLVRPDRFNQQTIWIPLEVTNLSDGFQESFSMAANRFYKQGVVEKGLIDKRVEIIDLELL